MGMLHKSFLVEKVVDSFLRNDFHVLRSAGCFDVAAKRKRLMLVKALTNIDGLTPDQAVSLRAVSYFMSAHPFVVSMKSNRQHLSNRMIYNRFELPVVTPEMFDSILEEGAYSTHSAKGRHSVEINAGALKDKRNKLNFTLQELAELVGISKKALYEIENKRVNPTEQTVRKLERVLKVELKSIFKPTTPSQTYVKPANVFEKQVSKEFNRIGVENSPIHHAPFEIVGKEKFSMITSLTKSQGEMKREAKPMKELSVMFRSSAFFVAKKSKEQEVGGVPVVLDKELPELDSAKELKKLIEDKI